jgi:DNA end-binding protein Ku
MAASVWSGYLTFGLISMPVRLFSGARSSGISFHQLHRTDLHRVKQQLICPVDNQVLDRSEIVKGYEYRKNEYVVVDPEEIKKIEPKTAKTMEILEFVKSSEVDPVYFDASYYMMPEAGRRPYALLTKALEESEYVAIAKLTMHNREYTVFLRPTEGGLMLHTMYYEEEVRKVEGFGAPDVELKDAEVKVAHQLIQALAAEWEPEKFKDEFQENLRKLIETKLEGGEVAEVEKPKKLAPVVDLMAALKQSLAQMEGKKKPAATVAEAPAARKRTRK